MSKLNILDAWTSVSEYITRTSAQSYLTPNRFAMAASGSCGSACGAGDKGKPAPKPSACGSGDSGKSTPKPSACGTGDNGKPAPKPGACGSACGAAGNDGK